MSKLTDAFVRFADFSEHFNFTYKYIPEEKTETPCYLTMVVKKHLRSATCNFLVVFVRGDGFGEDNGYGRLKDGHATTAGVTEFDH